MNNQIMDFSKPKNGKKILISEEQNGMMIWLGNNEVIQKSAGQVFYNAIAAQLESVAVMPQIAMPGSKLIMELYSFDATVKKMGSKNSNCRKAGTVGRLRRVAVLFF